MTTYSKDFSDEGTTGVFASDFTARYAAMSGWLIQSTPTDAEDDRVFESDGTDTGIQLASWDDIDGDANRDNSEIVTRFECTTDDVQIAYQWLRASGSGGSETSYCCRVTSGGNLRIVRFDAGTPTNLGSSFVVDQRPHSPWSFATDDTNFNYPIARWLYVRFRVNGTGATVTLNAKFWFDGMNEPTDWHLTTTDTSGSRITAAGWTGIGRETQSSRVVDWDYVGVGTNGDTAPITASTNTTARITQSGVEAIVGDSTPEFRITGAYKQLIYMDGGPAAAGGTEQEGALIIAT